MWLPFYSLVLMKQKEGWMILILLKLWLQLSQRVEAISRLSTDVSMCFREMWDIKYLYLHLFSVFLQCISYQLLRWLAVVECNSGHLLYLSMDFSYLQFFLHPSCPVITSTCFFFKLTFLAWTTLLSKNISWINTWDAQLQQTRNCQCLFIWLNMTRKSS